VKLGRLIGFHAVMARLSKHPESVVELFADARREDARMAELKTLAARVGLELQRVDGARLAALAQSPDHQGVVALVEQVGLAASLQDVLTAVEGRTEPGLFLLLDQVQDPHNLGAAMRSAAAFGVDAVIVPRHGAAPRSPAAQKAASGAFELTPLIEVVNLVQAIEALQQAGVWIYGAESDAEGTLFDVPLDGPIAWVLGNEGRGLRRLTRERCDRRIAIPMQGAIESLNVSVAAAICLFATRAERYRRAADPMGSRRKRPR